MDRQGLNSRKPIGRVAFGLCAVAALSACSPDHLYSWRGRPVQATVATYEDTRLAYRNGSDPKLAAQALLPTEAGKRARKLRYEDTRTPHCDDKFVLAHIKRRTPLETWNTTHETRYIESFGHAVQREYQPRQGRNQIAQRFCTVNALFSDHKHRKIDYVIETPMGFAGVGHNVTYCIRGLDPWYVHGGHCSALRDQGPVVHTQLPEAKHRSDHPAWRKGAFLGENPATRTPKHPHPRAEAKPRATFDPFRFLRNRKPAK